MSKNGNAGVKTKPMNRNLGAARAAKQDEFYTQYVDVQARDKGPGIRGRPG